MKYTTEEEEKNAQNTFTYFHTHFAKKKKNRTEIKSTEIALSELVNLSIDFFHFFFLLADKHRICEK